MIEEELERQVTAHESYCAKHRRMQKPTNLRIQNPSGYRQQGRRMGSEGRLTRPLVACGG